MKQPHRNKSKQSKNHNVDSTMSFDKVIDLLSPLGIPLGETKSGDWLEEHKESGQTFHQYVACHPTTSTAQRCKIYIVPLGYFTERQKKLVARTCEFLEVFYGLPVIVQDAVGLETIHPKDQRTHWGGGDQILTTPILDKLAQNLPSDAATYICFTTSDLYPKEGWNFVLGQGSSRRRVGVWSLCRFGNKFRQCLERTLSIAVHETGHMLGMKHCTAYSCGMCGINSVQEADRRPIHFCPECSPKILYATGVNLVQRAHKLAALCETWGLKEEASYYAKSATLLSKPTIGVT